MEEIELVKRMKQGDQEAFDELYEKYKVVTLRMAYLICGHLADSEDIVQETFVKCYEHIEELKKEEGFKSWLFQILTRTAWKYCKKQSKECPEEDIMERMPVQKEASSLQVLLDKEQHNHLLSKINQLNVKHRTTIILYYYNGLSTKEIAKILGCLEGTVKSRLFVARRLLKESIVSDEKEEGVLHERWI